MPANFFFFFKSVLQHVALSDCCMEEQRKKDKFQKRKAVFQVYEAKGPLHPFVKGYEIATLQNCKVSYRVK